MNSITNEIKYFISSAEDMAPEQKQVVGIPLARNALLLGFSSQDMKIAAYVTEQDVPIPVPILCRKEPSVPFHLSSRTNRLQILGYGPVCWGGVP